MFSSVGLPLCFPSMPQWALLAHRIGSKSALALPFRPFGRHPQDLVFPLFKLCAPMKTVFPQSQTHSHTTRPLFRWSVGRITVSLPNFCPARSSPLKHPQDFVRPLFKLCASIKAVFPQSQTHSHTTLPLFRWSVGRIAVSLPNFCPVRSTALSFRRHPQDLVPPLFKLCASMKTVFPQSQMHSHTTPPLFRWSVARIAVSLPNFCPVKSLGGFATISPLVNPNYVSLPFFSKIYYLKQQ